jgi:dTDP-4-amino-4,6-dideoxygalactose transaminase
MGLSPIAVKDFLSEFVILNNRGESINKKTGKRIAACVPMHTFGFPLRIEEVVAVCEEYNIPVVEDAAEALGSYYKGKHTGSFGLAGVFSFNGNKTITCGGGGAIITNDEEIAGRAKHISTTAKLPHAWEFVHDEVAYNYRMPNLNAALGCAQLEKLKWILENKKKVADSYQNFFLGSPIHFISDLSEAKANYWLNSITFSIEKDKKDFLEYSNAHNVMTRPIWKLMNKLPMYNHCQCDDLKNASWIEQRVVNLPSSIVT